MIPKKLQKEEEAKYQACKSLLMNDRNMCNNGDFFGLARGREEWIPRLCEELPFFKDFVDKWKLNPSKKLFNQVKKVFKKYLDTNELNYDLLTIWTLGTYFHSQFETYPLITLMARKQSGKTRTLKLLSTLSSGSDGSVSTSITETHLFRHKEGALFFDEMESISSKDKTALRETINTIYKRGNKITRYIEGKDEQGNKDFIPKHFFPFYPLGIANIYGFGDVLADRSLQLVLQRSKNSKTRLVEDFTTNKEILSLKENLSKMCAEIPKDIFSEWNSFMEFGKVNNKDFLDIFEMIKKSNLHGRSLEIFLPLFVVSKIFGVLDILEKSSNDYMERLEADVRTNPDDLLQEFLEKSSYEGYISLKRILQDFKDNLENPEEWMNPKWLGNALRRLDFITKTRKVSGITEVLLNIKSTKSIISTISTISTKSTKKVDLVDLGDLVEQKGKVDIDNFDQLKKEYQEEGLI